MRFIKYTEKENAESKGNSASQEKSSKRSTGSFWAKVICVLAAMLVWFYVSGEQSATFEKDFYNIQVNFEGISAIEKQGYTIISGDNASVDVTVKGTRSEVNSIRSKDDIIVTCDLSDIFVPDEYTRAVTVTTPGNTEVTAVTPEAVVVYIDKASQKEIPVIAKVTTGGTTELDIRIDELEPSYDTVRVTGPAEELEKIDYAATDVALDGLIKNSTEWNGELYLVAKDGTRYSNAYVKMDKTSIKVLVPVYKYKTVPVEVSYSGMSAEELGCDVSLSVKSVEIRGNADVIDTIESVMTESVDISKVSGKTVYSEKLVVPPGTELTSDQPESVLITVVPGSGSSTSVTTSNIVLINIPKGYFARLEEDFKTFEFAGGGTGISKLGSNNVYAVADLSGCSEPGTYDIKLAVNYPYSDSIKLKNDYSCRVTIYK